MQLMYGNKMMELRQNQEADVVLARTCTTDSDVALTCVDRLHVRVDSLHERVDSLHEGLVSCIGSLHERVDHWHERVIACRDVPGTRC